LAEWRKAESTVTLQTIPFVFGFRFSAHDSIKRDWILMMRYLLFSHSFPDDKIIVVMGMM
jgi:hypothetical protein